MTKGHLRFKMIIFRNLRANISNEKNQARGDFGREVKEGRGWNAEESHPSVSGFLNY